MNESANIDTIEQPAPTATVYGMPAYVDRAAAVGEVHARPHLLIQAPRGILQFAFMTEGDLAKDRAAMSELSHRFGVAEPDHATRLHGLTWDEGDLHCEKHTEFSTYFWCASLDPETGEPCGENPFRHGFVPPGPVVSDKLNRAISLLRSWIDVELERQNRDLLASMNDRTKMQLRLQQTAEGLSVAAISYYVVNLLGDLLKGIPGIRDIVEPDSAVAILVPVVMLSIWWTVRRIRHAHGDPAVEEMSS